jgi:hypothetical protein
MRPVAPSITMQRTVVIKSTKSSNLSKPLISSIYFEGSNLHAIVIRIDATTGIGMYENIGSRNTIIMSMITPDKS